MAEELKRVEREFQIVKQSSSDIVDEEGEKERRMICNVTGTNATFSVRLSMDTDCAHRLLCANMCAV